MLLGTRHRICLTLVAFLLSSATSSAEPRLTHFTDNLVDDVPIGLPSFVGVQLLRRPEAGVSETISFTHRPALGTRLCLAITSQDGRYNASGEIDTTNTPEGAQSVKLPLAGTKRQFVTGLLERELAVELTYRQSCTDGTDAMVRPAIWFGADKPGGAVSLLLQALDDDAYLVADQSSPGKRQKCEKIVPGRIRSTAAFNTVCQLDMTGYDDSRQIEIKILDPFDDPEKSIPVKVAK